MDFNKILSSLSENLLAPIPLCFALGIFCKLIHGGIKIPKELYYTISIFLLMSIGFMGGHELALADLQVVLKPALVTLLLGCLTPIIAYVVLRYLGRMSVADAAGIAAHYGSTSAVTFAVAQNFVESQGHPMNGYLPTLVTILECPGIAIALAIGAAFSKVSEAHSDPGAHQEGGNFKEAIYEVLTGQSIMLMAGLLIIGYISTNSMPKAKTFAEHAESHATAEAGKSAEPEKELTAEEKAAKADAEKAAKAKEKEEKMKIFATSPFYPFYQFFLAKGMIFRGALCIFLLEMGLVAGERLKDLLKVGPFLIAFGILIPLLHGFMGAWLGHWAGLNLGGCTVFAAIVSSASYIAAPPAVRLTLPEANPTLSITASLAITFPFNIAFGIPIYYQMAQFVGATWLVAESAAFANQTSDERAGPTSAVLWAEPRITINTHDWSIRMQLYPLKLVTIIAETILREPIIHKILDLGATGVSYHSTGGTGSRHSRHDVVLGENVQIKVICPKEVAEKILTFVSHNYFVNYACIAWMNDVEVVRGAHYAQKPE